MKIDTGNDHDLHVSWRSRHRIRITSTPPSGKPRHVRLTLGEAVLVSNALMDLVEADAAQ